MKPDNLYMATASALLLSRMDKDIKDAREALVATGERAAMKRNRTKKRRKGGEAGG